MQTASYRIWTRVIVSIFFYDNRYPTSTSCKRYVKVVLFFYFISNEYLQRNRPTVKKEQKEQRRRRLSHKKIKLYYSGGSGPWPDRYFEMRLIAFTCTQQYLVEKVIKRKQRKVDIIKRRKRKTSNWLRGVLSELYDLLKIFRAQYGYFKPKCRNNVSGNNTHPKYIMTIEKSRIKCEFTLFGLLQRWRIVWFKQKASLNC